MVDIEADIEKPEDVQATNVIDFSKVKKKKKKKKVPGAADSAAASTTAPEQSKSFYCH